MRRLILYAVGLSCYKSLVTSLGYFLRLVLRLQQLPMIVELLNLEAVHFEQMHSLNVELYRNR